MASIPLRTLFFTDVIRVTPLRVCIIDEDCIFREGLAFLINHLEGYQVVSSYPDCCLALQQLTVDKPQLIVMELEFSACRNGVSNIQRIRGLLPQVKVLVLSAQTGNALVFGALQEGVVGYLAKSTPLPKLFEAIGEVRAGGAPLSQSIARMVVESFHRNRASPLSKREAEVLRLLARGKSSRMIAQVLFVDKETIRTHIKNIYGKLKVHSKADAIEKAFKERLI